MKEGVNRMVMYMLGYITAFGIAVAMGGNFPQLSFAASLVSGTVSVVAFVAAQVLLRQ